MSRFDFDRAGIADRYDRGRTLPGETIRQWLDEIAKHLPTAAGLTVLDLGCGTGRFTAPLARRLSARVVGLDSAAKMLAVAAQTLGDAGAVLVRGTADLLPFSDRSFDVVFLSMILHHIRSSPSAIAETWRVLKPGGKLLIRTASIETMGSYLWASFFPEGARAEASRILSRTAIRNLLSMHGFTLDAEQVVMQLFASDLRDYCDRIAQRALSSLQVIPEPLRRVCVRCVSTAKPRRRQARCTRL
jgi:ubiquinone/menaquinone biosynthesis C-methylase UbiE